jgi:urease gamma subunit
MDLTPREKDQLLLFTAGLLAERRRHKGLKLNYPEAIAYISCAILEGAREGKAQDVIIAEAQASLTRDDVLPGVADMIPEIVIEATFHDGLRVLTIAKPIT